MGDIGNSGDGHLKPQPSQNKDAKSQRWRHTLFRPLRRNPTSDDPSSKRTKSAPLEGSEKSRTGPLGVIRSITGKLQRRKSGPLDNILTSPEIAIEGLNPAKSPTNPTLLPTDQPLQAEPRGSSSTNFKPVAISKDIEEALDIFKRREASMSNVNASNFSKTYKPWSTKPANPDEGIIPIGAISPSDKKPIEQSYKKVEQSYKEPLSKNQITELQAKLDSIAFLVGVFPLDIKKLQNPLTGQYDKHELKKLQIVSSWLEKQLKKFNKKDYSQIKQEIVEAYKEIYKGEEIIMKYKGSLPKKILDNGKKIIYEEILKENPDYNTGPLYNYIPRENSDFTIKKEYDDYFGELNCKELLEVSEKHLSIFERYERYLKNLLEMWKKHNELTKTINIYNSVLEKMSLETNVQADSGIVVSHTEEEIMVFVEEQQLKLESVNDLLSKLQEAMILPGGINILEELKKPIKMQNIDYLTDCNIHYVVDVLGNNNEKLLIMSRHVYDLMAEQLQPFPNEVKNRKKDIKHVYYQKIYESYIKVAKILNNFFIQQEGALSKQRQATENYNL